MSFLLTSKDIRLPLSVTKSCYWHRTHLLCSECGTPQELPHRVQPLDLPPTVVSVLTHTLPALSLRSLVPLPSTKLHSSKRIPQRKWTSEQCLGEAYPKGGISVTCFAPPTSKVYTSKEMDKKSPLHWGHSWPTSNALTGLHLKADGLETVTIFLKQFTSHTSD